MYDSFGHFIDSAWVPFTGATAPVFSPVSERPLGQAPMASVADTKGAIAAAGHGLAAWKAKPAFDRADALHAIADEIKRRTEEAVRMITQETGKPIAQSGREWGLAVNQFRWFAEKARRFYGRIIESRVPVGRFEVLHETDGIVAAFTAWNFPAALVARKLASALAAVCSAILRPPSQTPGVAIVMVDCCRAGNLPAGVANLVIGPTDTRARAIKLGDGLDPTLGKGPLINAGRLAEMERIVAGATEAGARLETGGQHAAGFNAGHFLEPTVLSQCTDDLAVMAQENFGPIAAIPRLTTDDEVLNRANACETGLSTYAFTRNPKRARRTVAELMAGMVGINHSGMGREGGCEAILDYLDVKSSQMVWI